MNDKLNDIQTIWFNEIFKPYIRNNPNLNISYPFFTGVSDEYIKSQKRIMIVGQETNGWNVFKEDWTIKDSRDWAIDYLNFQLKYCNYQDLKEIFKRRNSSPFWSFFKAFSNDGIVPCWNNIDKAQRKFGNQTKALTVEIEAELNKTITSLNTTLFLKEIEITKPDIIIFITGPNYQFTMEKALQLEQDTLRDFKPTHNNGCVDITNQVKLDTPTFWTYHPRHICDSKNELSREKIVKKIKQGFE